MRKKIALGLAIVILTSCAEKKVEPKKLNYSLLDEIYTQVDKKAETIVSNIVERRGKVLKVPKYIKVFRGSYRDENGNVVEAGFQWLRVDDGIPDTNF